MCLIVFAWKICANTPLIVASNRDEYYERASLPANWWGCSQQVFAGRDLQGGGTWMGVACETPDAARISSSNLEVSKLAKRFAAITNIRGSRIIQNDAPSRGNLVAEFLKGTASATDYIESIRNNAHLYNGFNLLVGDHENLIWFSNQALNDERNGKPLEPGIYGISNAALDTPWHKVVKTKAEFASLLCQGAPNEAYFEMLSNTMPAPDCRLPDTGVSFDMERLLSSPCIESTHYGTRASSLLRIHSNGEFEFYEKLLR
jgi:uncharacterized protein with NRDE domain